MNLVKLTPENVKDFIGHEIMFRTRKQHVIKTIIGVSPTGKTIYIDHPDLGNNLEIVNRDIFVIIR